MPPAVCRPVYKAGAVVTDGSGRWPFCVTACYLFESALNGERRPGDTSGVFAPRCEVLLERPVTPNWADPQSARRVRSAVAKGLLR
jgi:hypothetical protein